MPISGPIDWRTGEHSAYLGLGSNLDPGFHLPEALRILDRYVHVATVSAAWESPAIDGDGPNYVNAAALIHTEFPPVELQECLKAIEDQLGRDRNGGEPRPPAVTIDLDLLLFDGEILEPGLWDRAHRAAARLARTVPIRPRVEILPGARGSLNLTPSAADTTRTPTP